MDISKLKGESLRRFIENRSKKNENNQLSGTDYYLGKQAIIHKKRLGARTDANGNDQYFEIAGLPNTIIVDNQYKKLTDQKVNYLISLPPVVEAESEQYAKALTEFMDRRFLRTLGKVVREAYNEGLGWLYLYMDDGELAYTKVDSREITPIWEDATKERLSALIRERKEKIWDDTRMLEVEKVYIEWYTTQGVTFFERRDGRLHETSHHPYVTQGDQAYNWTKIPFVYFRMSAEEQTLLDQVKSLQDGINIMLSNYADNMLEDARNSIMVLKGYDGSDPVQARQEILTTGIIQLAGGADSGDVDVLNMDVNSSNYESILRLLKEKLIENGRGVDAKNDKSGQAPNQLNIKSMYSDIELDANGAELELQASFEYLQWFFRQVYGFGDEVAIVRFRRNMMINEEAVVSMIRNSQGILSDETLISQHPFVEDVTEELRRIEKEYDVPPDPFGGVSPETLKTFLGGGEDGSEADK